MTRNPIRSVAAALTGAVVIMTATLAAAAQAGEQLVRLDAVMAEGKKPIYDAMTLNIWRLDGGKAVERIAERHAAPTEIALKVGHYRVVADYRNARRVTDIEVSETVAARHVINLNAGRVRLNLLPDIDGDPVRRSLNWEIRRYRRGSEPGRKVADVQAGRPELLLSAGWYEVHVTHRERTVRHVVEVTAGTELDYAILMKE